MKRLCINPTIFLFLAGVLAGCGGASSSSTTTEAEVSRELFLPPATDISLDSEIPASPLAVSSLQTLVPNVDDALVSDMPEGIWLLATSTAETKSITGNDVQEIYRNHHIGQALLNVKSTETGISLRLCNSSSELQANNQRAAQSWRRIRCKNIG